MNDLISVIVPIYNSSKYLNECLNSILNQTYKNLEIILINDGSTDNSLEICREFKKRDKRVIIIDKANTGVSDSRNFGIENSNGKYIIFVDSDDVLNINLIYRLYSGAIEKNVDVVRCNYQGYYNKNKGKIYDLADRVFEGNQIKPIIKYFITNYKNIPSYIWLLLIKKEKIVEFDTTLYFMEDTEFFIRLLLNIDSIYFINECLYYYRYNSQSASKNSINVISNIFGILESENKIKKFLDENGLLDDELEKRINAVIFSLIISKIKLLPNKEINSKNLKKVLSEEKVSDILNNINFFEIPKKILLEFFLLKQKKFWLLFTIIKIKNKIKGSKKNVSDFSN